jgi:hypothetical protein
MVSDPLPEASFENEKAGWQHSNGGGSRHVWEPQKVRQDDIILKRPTQRWIFFGGVAAAAVLGVAIAVLAGS